MCVYVYIYIYIYNNKHNNNNVFTVACDSGCMMGTEPAPPQTFTCVTALYYG